MCNESETLTINSNNKIISDFSIPFNFPTIIFSLSWWLRGKSELPCINDKVKLVKIVKNGVDLKNSVFKVVG